MKLNLIKSMSVVVCAAGMLIAAALEAKAITTFSASSGGLSAEVIITQMTENQFTVLLRNTGANDVLVPIDVLTGVFFNYYGGTLTPLSAVLGGSTVLFGLDGGGNVGGEWAYGSGLAGAPHGASQGISTAGLGLFGRGNFGGLNLEGPEAVSGLGYGITTAGDNPITGNTPVTGTNPLIKNSVLFTFGFTGTYGYFDSVSFQYGTSLTEPNVNVPDGGSTIALLGSALVGVGALRRKLLKA